MPAEMARNPLLNRLASALFALFALLCLALPPGAARAQTLILADALTADDKGEGHFPAEAAARTVSLPDDWARTRGQAHNPLWYRLRFDGAALAAVPGSAGPLALFIERACANVEVQLNGQVLYAAGRMSDPVSLECQRPLLLTLPAALLLERGNFLDLRLAGYALQEVASSQRAARCWPRPCRWPPRPCWC
jgi:two-component system, NarL family, sensor histidine kinase UhpB